MTDDEILGALAIAILVLVIVGEVAFNWSVRRR